MNFGLKLKSSGRTYQELYSLLLQIITIQLHFSCLMDILIGKSNDFWAVGKPALTLLATFHAGTRKS